MSLFEMLVFKLLEQALNVLIELNSFNIPGSDLPDLF